MRILNKRGFSLAEVLIIVVVVGALAGTGTVVYKNQQNDGKTSSNSKQVTNFDECVAAGNPVAESYPEQCSANGQTYVNDKQQAVLSLDESKVPKGWNATNNNKDIIALDNSAIDLDPTESCSVEAQHVVDKSATEAKADAFAAQQRADYAKTIKDNKGYETQKLSDTKLTVMFDTTAWGGTGEYGVQQNEIMSFYDLVTLPASEYGMYEKKAYIVKDGHYVSVKQSCQSNDFTEADKALLAIIIRI